MANTEQTGKAKQNYTNEQKTKENQNKTKLKTTQNIKRMSNTGVNPGTQERQALPASYNTPIVLIMYKVSVMYLLFPLSMILMLIMELFRQIWYFPNFITIYKIQ